MFRVQAIVPKGPIFDVEKFKYLNRIGSMRVAREAKRLFEKTTRTWDHYVSFHIRDSAADDFIEVGTSNDLYVMINDGVPAHVEMNRPGGIMSFQRQYIPKTIPGILNSYSGGSRGEVVRAKFVWHPGVEARGFDREVMKLTEDMFARLKIGAIVEANK